MNNNLSKEAPKLVTLNFQKVTPISLHYEKKHSLRIRFRIRAIVGTNQSYILTRITLNGQRCKSDFATGLKIETSSWDSKAQKVMGKDSRAFNDCLDKIRHDLVFNFETYVASRKPFTADDLRHSYIEDIPEKKTLVDISALLLESKIRKLAIGKRAVATIRKAKERHENLKWVFEKTGWQWPLDQIKPRQLEELEIYLRHATKWHWNTVSKILNYFKEVIRYGQADGWIPARPIALRVMFVETPHHALTHDQVKELANLEFTNPDIQKAADCFLFQCYTGLAYSDMKQFDSEIHLKVNNLDELIELKRKKSPLEGKSLVARIPVLPAAKRILEKYANRLPVLSNQNYNPYLHLIGEILKLDFKLTSHIARKTFCTILFNAGLSLEMIGEFVGHHTAKTTLASYAKGEPGRMKNEVELKGFGT